MLVGNSHFVAYLLARSVNAEMDEIIPHFVKGRKANQILRDFSGLAMANYIYLIEPTEIGCSVIASRPSQYDSHHVVSYSRRSSDGGLHGQFNVSKSINECAEGCPIG